MLLSKDAHCTVHYQYRLFYSIIMSIWSRDGLSSWLIRSADPILCLSTCKMFAHDALQHELLVLRLLPGLDMQVKIYLVSLHNLLKVRSHRRLSQSN